MVPALLKILEFRSNNAVHRPVLDALACIRLARKQRRRLLDIRNGVPFDGMIPAKWWEFVIGADGWINLIEYELCVLKALGKRIRAPRRHPP